MKRKSRQMAFVALAAGLLAGIFSSLLSTLPGWATSFTLSADCTATSGAVISAAKYNNCLTGIQTGINTIDNDRVLAGAGIVGSKLDLTSGTGRIQMTPAAFSGVPSTTGSVFNAAAVTFTDSDTAASGTAASFAAYAFQRPTLAAVNTSVTTTTASTLSIAGPPIAGTNQILTNPYALNVATGNSFLGGSLLFTDATYDIGASGATRPRHVYASGNAVFGGTGAFSGTTLAVRGVTYTWPAADGAASTVLQTNGSATLSWVAGLTTLAPVDIFGPGLWPGADSTYVANQAYLFPFTVHKATTVRYFRFNVAVQSGNIDVGIYTAAGAKVASTGSSGISPPGTMVLDLTNQSLTAGTKYFAAVALDNATASLRQGPVQQMPYSKTVATSFPLPASFTAPVLTDAITAVTPGFWVY